MSAKKIGNYYLAIDIGASSGRHILGHLENGKLCIEEIYRFPNGAIQKDGHLVWDIDGLFENVLIGMEKCRDAGKIPSAVSIDTWGVDYVLLDKDGNRLCDAVSYRDHRNDHADKTVEKTIPMKELYLRTGIQKQQFNTICQLAVFQNAEPEILRKSNTLLLIPDYLNYLLTGVMRTEYTNASTTGLLDAISGTWDMDLIKKLNLPTHIFTPVFEPGTTIGSVKENIAKRIGYSPSVYMTTSHDTASAILAIPAENETDYTLVKVPVSLHCWQGDDVKGFDSDSPLSGGIQTTGNYPGAARSPEELFDDLRKVIEITPGKKKINVHASYAVFKDGEFRNRNELIPKDFKAWVDFAKEYNVGLDFNPTFFGHSMVKDGLTLTSPDESVREFWIEHGKACVRIANYFAKELGEPCVLNFWIGDGFKDIPADRLTPRLRYKDSLDKILSEKYDPRMVKPCVESKVFGIGVESYTAGSSEFTLNYAALHKGVLPLMDNGHYHPTEVVSDKIPALLAYFDEIALHITRPVRWDSDHVVLFDDETREMAKEIVRNDALGRVYTVPGLTEAVTKYLTDIRENGMRQAMKRIG
ncbi:MAG: L-rhamnose isomerase [Lachnospiraceae bacterium]|nr:L-rhamnose isomerase [Lachnospiraceae bacterium]